MYLGDFWIDVYHTTMKALPFPGFQPKPARDRLPYDSSELEHTFIRLTDNGFSIIKQADNSVIATGQKTQEGAWTVLKHEGKEFFRFHFWMGGIKPDGDWIMIRPLPQEVVDPWAQYR